MRAAADPDTNPWVIAVVVSIATFMEVLDTTIANVALRYIAGGLAVSNDEAAWLVTTYLIANAIALTASGSLAERYGRKGFYLACLGLFTVSSLLCGLAWSLDSLLLFRLLQGFGGGGMVPVSQSILADAFPPGKRGQGFAVFGIAVVVAPVVGPTLGGYIADTYSWHWCFLINVPVGILSFALVSLLVHEPRSALERRREIRRRAIPFDFTGFALVATFLGALEVVLDRGQTEDWFASSLIIVFTGICVLALVATVLWEWTCRDPVLDLRMIATRQFGACFVVMLAIGAILIATTQFLPLLLQEYYGYTATWAGLALSPGGLVTMVMMFVVGRLSSLVPAKYLVAAGAAVAALAMADLTRVEPDATFWFFAWSRMYLGLGLPLIFIPIIAASYDGVPPDKTDQASGLMNVARNVGGSIGVSVAQNVQAYRQQFHHLRLASHIFPSSVAYHDMLAALTRAFASAGAGAASAQRRAFAEIARRVEVQAGLMAFIDVFAVLALLAALAVPLALILRGGRREQGRPGVG